MEKIDSLRDSIIEIGNLLNDNEVDIFLKELETAITLIRTNRKKFKLEYENKFYSNKISVSQSNYIIPFWCFLFYSQKQYKEVIDCIYDFVKYDFGLVSEIDFERTKSGAWRAFNNLRFAGNKLKKFNIIEEKKNKNWKSFQLSEYGLKTWVEIEDYYLQDNNEVFCKELFSIILNGKSYNHIKTKKVIETIKNQLKSKTLLGLPNEQQIQMFKAKLKLLSLNDKEDRG